MNLALQDAVIAGVWSSVSALIVGSSFRLSKRLFPSQRTSSHVLVTTVLAVGTVNFSLLAVGAVGYFSNLPALTLAIVVCGLFRLLGSTVSPPLLDRDGDPGEADHSPHRFALAIWWIAASACAGHVVINGLLRFPEDWDTLMYHLPFIDFWIQSGSLDTMQSARWSTPATGELVGAWFALPFSGDFLATLTNVPIFILLASGAIEVARRLGMRDLWPHLVAVGCLATQVTFRQSVDVSNDVAVAAFFLSGLAFAYRYHVDGSLANASLFGICFGLLCGVKYFALGYAAVLLGMWGLLVVIRAIRRRLPGDAIWTTDWSWSDRRLHNLSAAVLAFLSGGYWYARNWWMTGYALYPKGSPDMSERILYDDLSKTTLVGNGSPFIPDLLADAVWKMAGPLHFVAVSALPALALIALATCAERFLRGRSDRNGSFFAGDQVGRVVLALGIIGCACIWAITPMLVEDQPGTLNHLKWGYGPVRYGIAFLSISVIGLFAAIDLLTRTLSRRVASWLSWFVGVAVLGQLVWHATRVSRFDLVTAGLLGLNLALATLLLQLLTTQFPRLASMRIPAAILSISIGVFYLSGSWHEGFAGHFDLYDGTRAHSAMNDEAHRLVVLSNRVYPFLGSRRQNVCLQPMLFYGVDAVAKSCDACGADIVATRVDNHKILARYRPAWDELAEDPRFEPMDTASNTLRLFHYQPVELDSADAERR